MATDRLQLVGGIGGIKIESAKVGQTIKVKAIDENGKPTEWESADFPEIGESNIYTYDSLDAVPADLPEGSFVAVPSGESKTVLFDGKPTRTDLTSMGFGVAYLCSADDLLILGKGQNIHYEVIAGSDKYYGVMSDIAYDGDIDAVIYTAPPILHNSTGQYTYPTLQYVPALGGTGFRLSGVDLGEVDNIRLWVEYDKNSAYYLTAYRKSGDVIFYPCDQVKMRHAALNGCLVVRIQDDGGNVKYITMFSCLDDIYNNVVELIYFIYYISNTEGLDVKKIRIDNGQVTMTDYA